MCVCVCVCVYVFLILQKLKKLRKSLHVKE